MTGLILAPQLIAPVAAAAFAVDAAVFDGTNDFMSRGAGLTGAADSKVATISFWISFNGGDGALQTIFRDDAGIGMNLERTAANKIHMKCLDSAGTTTVAEVTSTTSVVIASGWTHVALAFDAVAGTVQLYLDGSADGTSKTTNNAEADWTRSDHHIGAAGGGGNKIDADLAEFYFNSVAFLDLSSNITKFRTTGGKPENLGSDGSTPSGSAPIMYHTIADGGAAADLADNQGGGGNFSITGTLVIAATSPSD